MIECLCCGPYSNNVYWLKFEPTKQAVVVDAATGSVSELENKLKGYEVHVFLTHGHWDHIAEAALFKERLKAKIYFPILDKMWLTDIFQKNIVPVGYQFKTFQPDVWLNDGDVFVLGGLTWSILSVPGHTQGQIAIYNKDNGWVFVGDTLFDRGFGRTDLPGGDYRELMSSLRLLLKLPETTTVYPGHGSQTTIGASNKALKIFYNEHARFLESLAWM